MNQPELFPESSSAPRQKRFSFPVFPGRFLRLRVAVEDLVFGALGLVLVLLAGFCLGVERGRGIPVGAVFTDPAVGLASAAATSARAASEPVPSGERPVPTLPAAVSPLPARAAREGGAAPQGAFAIQLASYVGMQSAQEEARRLARQGLTPEVIKQGKYVELRAVGFRSWSDAHAALAPLRKTYRDAFIKRLSAKP